MQSLPPVRRIAISLGGETVSTTSDKFKEVSEALVQRHPGAGIPKVTMLDSVSAPAQPQSTVIPAPPAPTAAPEVKAPVRGVTVSEEGAARSAQDRSAALASGFAPRQPLYTAGTMVVEMGVDNARESRRDWEAKALVTEYCGDFIQAIKDENRRDLTVLGSDIRMSDSGLVSTDRVGPLLLSSGAIPGIAYNLGIPSGGTYLQKIPAELRSVNVNYFSARLAELEEAAQAKYATDMMAWRRNGSRSREKPEAPEKSVFKLRVRDNAKADKPEVFAAVSSKYGAYDVDMIAEAVRMATHPEARGSVTYDGEKARFEVLFHTNVKPEDFVAGEFFKAGVIITTDDTGGGSIRGSSVVWQNLCLNLLILDQAKQNVFKIKHIGNVQRMADEFREGFRRAQATINHFVKTWGFAVHDDLTVPGHLVADTDDSLPNGKELLAGILNGILDRELVPVRGWRKKDAVPEILKAWGKDESGAGLAHGGINRAAVVNAFTRFAHESPQPDVWAQDEIQSAAAALLFGKERRDGSRSTPAPLPFKAYDGDLPRLR